MLAQLPHYPPLSSEFAAFDVGEDGGWGGGVVCGSGVVWCLSGPPTPGVQPPYPRPPTDLPPPFFRQKPPYPDPLTPCPATTLSSPTLMFITYAHSPPYGVALTLGPSSVDPICSRKGTKSLNVVPALPLSRDIADTASRDMAFVILKGDTV